MKIICVVVVSLILLSCVTDYGLKPKPVDGLTNVYEFSVYYSGPLDRQEIKVYANNIARKLANEKGCSVNELKNLGNKLPGDRYYDYRVKLDC